MSLTSRYITEKICNTQGGLDDVHNNGRSVLSIRGSRQAARSFRENGLESAKEKGNDSVENPVGEIFDRNPSQGVVSPVRAVDHTSSGDPSSTKGTTVTQEAKEKPGGKVIQFDATTDSYTWCSVGGHPMSYANARDENSCKACTMAIDSLVEAEREPGLTKADKALAVIMAAFLLILILGVLS